MKKRERNHGKMVEPPLRGKRSGTVKGNPLTRLTSKRGSMVTKGLGRKRECRSPGGRSAKRPSSLF